MQELLKNIQIRVNDHIYNKDPDSSDLGRSILRESLVMIHEGGLEVFTFKKLANALGTTESTIYRYFENKHKLLLYLMSWHWGWLEYELVLGTSNLANTSEKLRKSIAILCNPLKEAPEHYLFNLRLLHEIVSTESRKIVHNKIMKDEIENGIFGNSQRIYERITDMIKAMNANYPHPKTLAAILIDNATQMNFVTTNDDSAKQVSLDSDQRAEFLWDLVYKTLTA